MVMWRSGKILGKASSIILKGLSSQAEFASQI